VEEVHFDISAVRAGTTHGTRWRRLVLRLTVFLQARLLAMRTPGKNIHLNEHPQKEGAIFLGAVILYKYRHRLSYSRSFVSRSM
jgi:hypothetical protein